MPSGVVSTVQRAPARVQRSRHARSTDSYSMSSSTTPSPGASGRDVASAPDASVAWLQQVLADKGVSYQDFILSLNAQVLQAPGVAA